MILDAIDELIYNSIYSIDSLNLHIQSKREGVFELNFSCCIKLNGKIVFAEGD